MSYRIFVVEDDNGIAQGIKDALAPWDLEAINASNFKDVVAQFKQVKPHLVLMDISLPFKDGYFYCSEIRKISSVPIIFISSASDNMNIVMAMNMGAVLKLCKMSA